MLNQIVNYADTVCIIQYIYNCKIIIYRNNFNVTDNKNIGTLAIETNWKEDIIKDKRVKDMYEYDTNKVIAVL